MQHLKFAPEKFFLITASVILSIMVFYMPLNRVPDEITLADASLQILSKDNIPWPDALAPEQDVNKVKYKELFTDKTDLSNQKFELNLKWSKIQHIPTLIGMRLGQIIYPSVGVIMTTGRIFNAAFFIISIFFIIKYMKYGKYALVFISLLPIMIQQAASLSYDVPNFISIAFFFAVISDIVTNHILTKKRCVLLLISVFGFVLIY